jgi:hypothetical protein
VFNSSEQIRLVRHLSTIEVHQEAGLGVQTLVLFEPRVLLSQLTDLLIIKTEIDHYSSLSSLHPAQRLLALVARPG